MNETTLTHQGKQITIERVVNAPKDKVWDAYSVPEIFAKWFSPAGWTTKVVHLDFTAGGHLLYGMKCEDQNQTEWFGKESWGKSAYSAISPKDSFTYKDYFTDADGNPTEGMPVMEVQVSLTETDGKAKITSVSTYESEAALQQTLAMGMEQGIKETFNKLASVLESE